MSDDKDLVVERVLDAPRDLVWRAYTTAEHVRKWWAPRPYQTSECEIDLVPGGKFYTRMTGPDGFEEAGSSCFIEIVPGEKVVWSSALLPGYRPAPEQPEDPDGCGGFPFTAIVTLEDAGEGKTRYRAQVLHRSAADRDVHAKMGFQDGWGTCADQLGEVAASLGPDA